MAEGDITIYNNFKEQVLLGVYDLSADTIKVTLHTGYTPNIDTHQVWGDTGVSSTEYGTGSGYTAGGVTLTGLAVAQDDANDRASWNANDALWSSLGTLSPPAPSHAIIWDDTPTAPADPLIAYVELGATATNGGDYTIQWNNTTNAIILLT